jgi:hypothetical protein
MPVIAGLDSTACPCANKTGAKAKTVDITNRELFIQLLPSKSLTGSWRCVTVALYYPPSLVLAIGSTKKHLRNSAQKNGIKRTIRKST